MHPKVVESFWSDLDFERFEGEELHGLRSAWLWIIAGPRTSFCGVFPYSAKKLREDMGMEISWLDRVMTAFPRAFDRDETSHMVLARNFIRYQFGSGEQLVNNRLMCVPIIRELRLAPLPLGRKVLEIYPELLRATDKQGKPLLSPSEALLKPLPSPSRSENPGSHYQALTKPLHDQSPQWDSSSLAPLLEGEKTPLSASPWQGLAKPSAEEQEKAIAVEGGVQRGTSDCIPPVTVEQCIAHGAVLGMAESECRAFFAYWDGLDWMAGGSRIRKPLSWMPRWQARGREKAHLDNRADQSRPCQSARLDNANGHPGDDLRAELQNCSDPARRREIEAQLRRAAA